MILKLQHVSVFFIKPSSGNKFVLTFESLFNLKTVNDPMSEKLA